MTNELKYMDVERLILRYKQNEATADEKSTLLDWVNHSKENKIYFQKGVSILDSIDNSNLLFDENKAFNTFLHQVSKPRKTYVLTPFLRVAASIIIVLGVALSALLYTNRAVKEVVVLSQVDGLSEQLPDNTTVLLNKGSKLVYPSRFIDEERHVEVQGQAFFDVERNEEKPFIIHVGPITVEVLGTSFDINLDTVLSSVTVTVETGKVKVTYPDNDFVTYLDPKEQCTINWGDKTVEEAVVEDDNYKGWLTKSLVFDASPLSKVVADLNKIYTKKIFVADNIINQCRLTAKLDNTPQKEILTMLEKSLHLEVIDNGEMYILIGEGCSQ